jgi:Zn finger protein HypA/HybF involved in hydrogenase expression
MASIIYTVSKEEFKKIVKESSTFTEVLKKCKLDNKGSNINTVKRRIRKDNLDSSHISKGLGHNKGRVFESKRVSLQQATEKYFIKNGKSQRQFLIKLIKRYNLINIICNECGIKDYWNNKKLSLQLDHVNGDGNDNRLENLRFLCPNCHSQTDTFAGKKHKIKYKCIKCEKDTKGNSNFCIECSHVNNRKVDRPSKEILEKEILYNSMVSIGKKYGVSDNAIRKWCQSYNINI